MHQFDFPSKFYQSVCLIPIESNMHCCWIEIEKRPKYKLHNIEDLSKITFWYHSNDTKVMLCSHWPINYLSGCLHITVYLAVMLQASWHTAEGTKSQKAHISIHHELQNFLTSNFLTIGPRVSKSGDRVTKSVLPSLNTKFA